MQVTFLCMRTQGRHGGLREGGGGALGAMSMGEPCNTGVGGWVRTYVSTFADVDCFTYSQASAASFKYLHAKSSKGGLRSTVWHGDTTHDYNDGAHSNAGALTDHRNKGLPTVPTLRFPSTRQKPLQQGDGWKARDRARAVKTERAADDKE